MFIEAIFAIGTIVITEFVRVITKEFFRDWANSSSRTPNYSSKHSNHQTGKSSKEVTTELEIIDIEFVELEKKKQHDGYTSRQDQEYKEELEILRANKFKDYQEAKGKEVAEEQSSNPENYETSALGNDKVHLLQYHMGQVVLEKKCTICQRPMILQSKNRLDGSLYTLDDFFWSCTGYYNDPRFECRGTQQFKLEDIGFIHKSDIFEFQISNQDLSTIFAEKSVQKATIERVKSHVREKDDDILCPIHHIPMILREKRQHLGFVLDMFFLRCPHQGCQQIRKLKSPAQLAAYLKSKEGRGIL